MWSGAEASSKRGLPEIRISGRVLVLWALWMLVIPLPWVVGMVLAAAVHEAGHLAALWMLDKPVLGLEIDIGGAVIRTASMNPGQELICALAGPAAGAILCISWQWYRELALCGAVQTAFNLIPVYPLDGGRAWRAARNICCKAREKGL